MKRIENECVGCPPEIGCLGKSCEYINVIRLYCDECEYEADILYRYDDEELCQDCLLGRFEIVSDEIDD